MSDRLNSLGLCNPTFRALLVELLARLAEHGIPVMLLETWRDATRQAKLRSEGRSWVSFSDHQHETDDGRPSSRAADLAPYSEYKLHGADKLEWSGEDPVWERIGTVAEGVGLKWGGRWRQRDLGHVYL